MSGTPEDTQGLLTRGKTSSGKKKLYTLVGSIAAVVVLIVVVVSIALAVKKNNDDDDSSDGTLFDFSDIFSNPLNPQSYGYQFYNNEQSLLYSSSQNLIAYNIATKERTTVFNFTQQQQNVPYSINFARYSVSPNNQYFMFATNYTKIWRHSILANYMLYDVNQDILFNLTDYPSDGNYVQYQIRNIQWSPSQQPTVAFVRNNNVFVSTISAWNDINEWQLTFDGTVLDDFYDIGNSNIMNGASDWLYEEEIFSSENALWWSNDGQYLAYAKFDDTQVESITYPWYTGNAYYALENVKYSKPGYTNPTIDIAIYNLAQNTTVWVNWDSYPSLTFEYVTYVTWDPVGNLILKLVPRDQTLEYTVSVNPTNGNIQTMLSEIQIMDGWVDSQPIFYNEDSATTCLYWSISSNGGYNHIIEYNWNDTAYSKWITEGIWDVTDIAFVSSSKVYFLSTKESPVQRPLYSINLDGTGLTAMLGTSGWYSVTFSPGGNYFVSSYSTAASKEVPTQTLLQTEPTVTELDVLTSNEDLKNLFQHWDLPTRKFIKVQSGNITLNAMMTFPPHFDSDKQNYYPMLVNVYGGPSSQAVTDTYFYTDGFHMFLASQMNCIVVSVDGRGTAGRGNQFMYSVYKQLGYYEVIDQISSAIYIAKSYPYIDESKVGIWGWSYGGYMTLMTLADSMNANYKVFKYGISVAPVTDWKYYDTFYSEKYMLTPSENPLYVNSSVITRIPNLVGKPRTDPNDYSIQSELLLVHGTADDNVHFQNSAEFLLNVQAQNIEIAEVMVYPNKDHGISARQHLYGYMADFLQGIYA